MLEKKHLFIERKIIDWPQTFEISYLNSVFIYIKYYLKNNTL